MSARVPLDVDLEDKLLYGLTPMRLAYVVTSLVAGFALWSSHWAPLMVRAGAAACVIALGAAAAWGRWRGRPADSWASDIFFFVSVNYRVAFDPTWRPKVHRPQFLRKPRASHPLGESVAASA